MSDTKGTACGVFPLLFRGWPRTACTRHDQAYSTGSWHQKNLTRKEVDDYFLVQLLELSGTNPAKRLASYTMYTVVRLIGWKYWEGKL